jgi:hypothetical protein
MMKNKVILNTALILCLALINWSCTDNPHSKLTKRIKEYYNFEQDNNWEKTYFFRTPSFQGSVPKEMYIKGMKKFMEGWTLQEYEIEKVSYNSQNTLAKVKIRFKERHAFKGISIITQPTTWKMLDGVWYGRDVGDRQHLPLNSSLVFQKY